MKRLLSILGIIAAITVVMVACNRNPQGTAGSVSYNDTIGLAQFRNWKLQNEQPQQVVVYKPAKTKTVAQPAASSGNYGSGSMNSVSENYAKTEKKGWSKAAKGAVIGGGSGAVLGAVVNKKNRVAGGVIGGVVGAGIGYLIGHSKDKKDGR